jgi:hypothetical protein
MSDSQCESYRHHLAHQPEKPKPTKSAMLSPDAIRAAIDGFRESAIAAGCTNIRYAVASVDKALAHGMSVADCLDSLLRNRKEWFC